MRILHVTPAYYPASYWGGPIFSVYGLNKALAAMKEVELKVLTTDSAGPNQKDRLEVDRLDYETLYPNFSVCFSHRTAGHTASLELLSKLPALVKWADLVHLSAVYSFPTIPTLLLCRILGKPLVWSPHGTLLADIKRAKPSRKGLKRLWLSICNALVQPDQVMMIATSELEETVSLGQIRAAKAAVVSNGVEAQQELPAKDFLPEDELRLLYLGRLDPIKGIENLLDALKLLGDPSITLSICGSGSAQYTCDLQQHAERLGLLGTNVTFLGQVDGEAKTSAFLNADVSVYPSYSESFAMVVAESLAHGLPVIVSRGTPWQRVEERLCGLWVDNSPESLAQAIRTIRGMKLADMGSRGHAWMKQEFGWDSVADKMYQIYCEMLA